MLLRDDHDAAPSEGHADAAADSTLERRVYYVPNWRWDIVALLADNGRVLERAWHEPYGTPWGLPAADFTTSNTSGNDDYGVPDGDADSDDFNYYSALFSASSNRADLTGSSTSTDFDYGRPDGTLDVDDSFYYNDILAAADTLGRGALSAEDGLRNRRGLSGYEWDATNDKYHVRHRVLRPETGRWTRRDPAGYVDGANLYYYAAAGPTDSIDPLGLACSRVGCIGIGESRVGPCDPPMDPPHPGDPVECKRDDQDADCADRCKRSKGWGFVCRDAWGSPVGCCICTGLIDDWLDNGNFPPGYDRSKIEDILIGCATEHEECHLGQGGSIPHACREYICWGVEAACLDPNKCGNDQTCRSVIEAMQQDRRRQQDRWRRLCVL